MKTALHLREYEDKLDPADIYSLLGTFVTYEPNLMQSGNCTCDSVFFRKFSAMVLLIN